MKFKALRSTATGKKFKEIENKVIDARRAQKVFAKLIGASEWRSAYWVVAGGISSVKFPKSTNVDASVWKNVNNKEEWMPRLNTKAGKQVQEHIDALPVVSPGELNACIGFKESHFKTIGFAMCDKKYFGFSINEEWKIKVPRDCVEITTSEYNKLFKD